MFLDDNIKQTDVQIESENGIQLITDHYWFTLSVQNLVDNAFKHGKPPVKIRTQVNKTKIYLYIEDQGSIESSKLEQLTQDFSKEKGGLGMGLIIVKKTLEALSMQLKITNTNPTQFCIEIPMEPVNE